MAVLAGGARGGEDDGIWMMEFDGGILTVGCPLIRQCSVQVGSRAAVPAGSQLASRFVFFLSVLAHTTQHTLQDGGGRGARPGIVIDRGGEIDIGSHPQDCRVAGEEKN